MGENSEPTFPTARFLKRIHKLAPTFRWSNILNAVWRSPSTGCTRMYADVYTSLRSADNSYCDDKSVRSCQPVCVCVCNTRHCTAIKYLEKPVLRKASCCVAPFNCTSEHLWILDAGLSLSWGSCKVPQLAGMMDNWITCMCQMFLINTSGPAGMGDWVLSRDHLLMECPRFLSVI